MTQEEKPTKTSSLKRSDWILLPLIGLFTICSMCALTVLLARQTFPRSNLSIYKCVHDSSVPMRGYSNVSCFASNNHDTPPVEYRLNSCGNRTNLECGAKPSGDFRIVLIGSSLSLGEAVPVQDTLAALLPKELTAETKQNVDLYNEGMWSEVPHVIAHNFGAALVPHPDMILWVLTPHDITVTSNAATIGSPQVKGSTLTREGTGLIYKIRSRFGKVSGVRSSPSALTDIWQQKLEEYESSSALVFLEHFLYKSQSQYVGSYLKRGDDDAGFLAANPSAKWQGYLNSFVSDDAAIQNQANAAHVPLVVVLVPQRAQAAMISMGQWPSGYDPYKLDNDLRSIITANGGTYIDILPGFQTIPNPEEHYFPVDGHPDKMGHALISQLLARELVKGQVPGLRVSSPGQVADHKEN